MTGSAVETPLMVECPACGGCGRVTFKKKHTDLEREQQARERRFVKEANHVGKRLEWVRIKLGLRQKEIAYEADVPLSTYCGREAGVRTGLHEEILLIAQTLDRRWQAKYKTHFPEYNGKSIQKISVLWLLYGGDPDAEEYDAIIEGLREEIRNRERQHAHTEAELRAQLSMFAEEEFK